jgi:hypothetical protein
MAKHGTFEGNSFVGFIDTLGSSGNSVHDIFYNETYGYLIS